MSKPNRYLMTQSLLSAFNYVFYCAEEQEEKAFADFVKTLRREKTPTTEAQQDGIDFEKAVIDFTVGKETPDKRWGETYKEVAEKVKGGTYQTVGIKEVTIDGIDFLLYGKADCLLYNTIYDIKFSKSYEYQKYFTSPQHPMYFELFNGVNRFVYVVSDGKYVYTEIYYKQDTRLISFEISTFIDYLKTTNFDGQNLFEIYKKNWVSEDRK